MKVIQDQNIMDPRIFLDVDGILADFTRGITEIHGKSDPYLDPANLGKYNMELLWGMPIEDFWQPANTETFWANLPLTTEAHKIMSAITTFFDEKEVCLLTSPTLHHESLSGKYIWIKKHFPSFRRRFLIGPKKHFCAGPQSLLIDDSDKNCKDFIQNGGKVFLYPRPWNELHKYKPDEALASLHQELKKFAIKFDRVDTFNY